MHLPDNLTPEQDAALVECLRLFAAHGRALRLARQQAQAEQVQAQSSSTSCAPAEDTSALTLLANPTEE